MARKKYYRHGNPEHFTYFNNEVWNTMTEEQKKNWVPEDEIEDQPVPEEVKDFMEEPRVDPNDDLGETKGNGLKGLKAEIKQLKYEIQKLRDFFLNELPDEIHYESAVDNAIELIRKLKFNLPVDLREPQEEPLSFDPTDRNFLKTELTKLGIEYGSRMPTKKLAELYDKTLKENTDANT